jgi:hypothetical protein
MVASAGGAPPLAAPSPRAVEANAEVGALDLFDLSRELTCGVHSSAGLRLHERRHPRSAPEQAAEQALPFGLRGLARRDLAAAATVLAGDAPEHLLDVLPAPGKRGLAARRALDPSTHVRLLFGIPRVGAARTEKGSRGVDRGGPTDPLAAAARRA